MSINPFLIPTSTAGRMKVNEAFLRQHDTDIQRLWNQMIALANSQGWPVTADPNPATPPSAPGAYDSPTTGGGGSGGGILYGWTTASYTKSGTWDGETNPGSITVQGKIPDPSATTGSNPWPYISDPAGTITVKVRSSISGIPNNTRVWYTDILLPDGSTEHQFLVGDC